MPEIIDRPAIGRLFSGGARELAAAIDDALALAQDPATRAACRARAEDFDAALSAAAHVEVYRSLLTATARGDGAPRG